MLNHTTVSHAAVAARRRGEHIPVGHGHVYPNGEFNSNRILNSPTAMDRQHLHRIHPEMRTYKIGYRTLLGRVRTARIRFQRRLARHSWLAAFAA